MKKVLIINTTFDQGGAATVAQDLFFSENNEYQFYFAYGRGKKNNLSRVFYFGNWLETLFHVFLVRFFGLEGVGNYFSTRKLVNFIKREKFDLVHLHNLHGYYLNFSYLIKFLAKEKIKVIWTIHDEWALTWLPAHSMGCEHCQTLEGKCKNKYSYPKNYWPILAKYNLQRKKKILSLDWNPIIISPAEWLTQNIKKSFLNKFEVRTITNGVDTNLFQPTDNKTALRTKYNLPTDKKIVLFNIGDVKDKNKGMKYIIGLIKNLDKTDYLFLGVGGGVILAGENVKSIGYIKDKKILSHYLALSDILCFTSLVETMPLTVLEALSTGLPIIAFDILALRGLINEKVGRLVSIDNRQLAENMLHLLNNEEILIDKGINAREHVLANYTKEKFLFSYFKLYNEL
ncbi:MAG: glycosyltransferase [Candidatus Magasanikiibacteriota bacterium]